MVAFCIADLTGSNIASLQLIGNKHITRCLLTFVNSARIFSGEIPGIKNPPRGRVACLIRCGDGVLLRALAYGLFTV